MVFNNFKCNLPMPLHFKGLIDLSVFKCCEDTCELCTASIVNCKVSGMLSITMHGSLL